MTRLVLVLGDQLTPTVAALRHADRKTDVVVMAEVMDEATYVPHHPKKIALFFAAMRKFARRLEDDGWKVAYTRLDDPDTAGSITGELLRRAGDFGATQVIATEPGEWRLSNPHAAARVTLHEDDRFIASHAEFEPGPKAASNCAWSGSTARCGARRGSSWTGRPRGRQVELRPRQPQTRVGRPVPRGPARFEPDET